MESYKELLKDQVERTGLTEEEVLKLAMINFSFTSVETLNLLNDRFKVVHKRVIRRTPIRKVEDVTDME